MSGKGNGPLPGTLDELKGMSPVVLEDLWARFFKSPLPKMDLTVLRLLWQRIQCQMHNCHLSQKHITRLNRYSKDPEGHMENARHFHYALSNGAELVKVFKGKRYVVQVLNGRYIYDGREYSTLSGAAMAICGKKVSGNDFFGLNNKGLKSRGGPAFLEKAGPPLNNPLPGKTGAALIEISDFNKGGVSDAI